MPKYKPFDLFREIVVDNFAGAGGAHAETNAIINGDPCRIQGATIYIAGFNADGTPADGRPCKMCARVIKNARICRAVY